MVRGQVGCYIRPLKVGGEEAVEEENGGRIGFIEGEIEEGFGDGSRVEKLWRRNENVKGKSASGWQTNADREKEGFFSQEK
jgi:hypothetical protein